MSGEVTAEDASEGMNVSSGKLRNADSLASISSNGLTIFEVTISSFI